MDINELNAKLVSELREIAKLIGITDDEKMRKQDLIKKIVASEDESVSGDTEAKAPSDATAENEQNPSDKDAVAAQEENANEKPRKRTRLPKTAQPVSDNRSFDNRNAGKPNLFQIGRASCRERE